MQALDPLDIEVKPDGIIYLPEIKYRRILNKAFGPGGWGLAPRGELVVGEKVVTREYALVVHGRYVNLPRKYPPPFVFPHTNIPTHTDSSPKRAASVSTFPRRRSRRPARAASRTRCCAAARTWALRRSCGTRASSASSKRPTAASCGSSTSSTRRSARSGRARTASRRILTRWPRRWGGRNGWGRGCDSRGYRRRRARHTELWRWRGCTLLYHT
jgi:hypothetical protein